MKLRTPHYYKDFRCIASECKDNCCVGGWQIDIDEETAREYLNTPGEFGDRLREAIDTDDGYSFKLSHGRCPFLDGRGLCEIYKELGEDKMGVVCAQFPRFSEYYGEYKESGIGLACEEAARIIISDKECFALEESKLDEEYTKDSEYDSLLSDSLFIYRSRLLELIDDVHYNIYQKFIILLKSADTLQHMINTNDYDAIRSYVEGLELTFDDDTVSDISATDGMYRVLCAYSGLEELSDDWSPALNRLFDTFYEDNMSDDKYRIISSQYIKYIEDHKREYEYNNIVKYYIFRYLMKAAYDHDIYGKALLTIANWLVIKDLDMAVWLSNDKQLSFDNLCDTIHLFSRQVEYSEDNLWSLNEEFLFDDIFQCNNMISLLKQFI